MTGTEDAPRGARSVIAHRARSTGMTDNTEAGLDRLVELGIQAVEVDIRLGDRGPVLAHDTPPPPDAPSIEAVLARADGFAEVMLDIKDGRAVEAVVEACAARGVKNVVLAGTRPGALIRAREHDPGARISLSFRAQR